jgi:ADP-ribose pyrophosphatase YjhB (NUDIX family)
MRYAVDAICFEPKSKKYVLIRRLSFPLGLALAGGGIEFGEGKDRAVIREVKEETGLTFKVLGWLDTVYNESGRDPRGEATSYVAYGIVEGDIRDEQGKTKVCLYSESELKTLEGHFAFDHFKIISDFLSSSLHKITPAM